MDKMTKVMVLVGIIGVTVEHCGEDADNGRYKDLGRAGGGGTPRGPARCGGLRKLPRGHTRVELRWRAKSTRGPTRGFSGTWDEPGSPKGPPKAGGMILRPKLCAGRARVARATGKRRGKGTRVAAGLLEGDTRVTPGSAKATPEHIARVTPGSNPGAYLGYAQAVGGLNTEVTLGRKSRPGSRPRYVHAREATGCQPGWNPGGVHAGRNQGKTKV